METCQLKWELYSELSSIINYYIFFFWKNHEICPFTNSKSTGMVEKMDWMMFHITCFVIGISRSMQCTAIKNFSRPTVSRIEINIVQMYIPREKYYLEINIFCL